MLTLLTACLFSMTSCIFIYHEPGPEEEVEIPDPEVFDRVNILYSAGHNNLSPYLKDDIDELAASAIMHWRHPYEALVIFFHSSKGSGYSPTEPELIRVRQKDGSPVYETIRKFPEETISADAGTFGEVLTYIEEHFPAKEYNLIFSSHCSGYLPEGYLGNSGSLEQGYGKGAVMPYKTQKAPVAYPFPVQTAGPLTKSIGADYDGSSRNSYEMNLKDFAEAIPMHLNSIIFDACFMGGIEVAYELKDKCRYLVASQAEVLADGMIYTEMGKRIFGGGTDLTGLCKDYYNHYNTAGPFSANGGIISMIDCSSLEPMAAICHNIFTRHRDAMEGIGYHDIQRFYRTGQGHYHGFYDLRDIILHAGCSEEEMNAFDTALAGCMAYKAATEGFLTSYGGFQITSHCGLSMYLPSHKGTYGNEYLNDYYRTLAWNKATGLVE